MPKYRLYVSFEIQPPDGSPFPESFDEIQEFNNIEAAEEKLESIISVMVSGYSDQGYQWTILEKCIEDQKSVQGTDLTSLVL